MLLVPCIRVNVSSNDRAQNEEDRSDGDKSSDQKSTFLVFGVNSFQTVPVFIFIDPDNVKNINIYHEDESHHPEDCQHNTHGFEFKVAENVIIVLEIGIKVYQDCDDSD